MDGLALDDAQRLVAPLSFLVPPAEKPVAYNYAPPPGVPQRSGQQAAYAVAIRDARALVPAPTLDREGFLLQRHRTSVASLYNEDAIATHYYPEAERLIQS